MNDNLPAAAQPERQPFETAPLFAAYGLFARAGGVKYEHGAAR